jgi:hypothetical protein
VFVAILLVLLAAQFTASSQTLVLNPIEHMVRSIGLERVNELVYGELMNGFIETLVTSNIW